MRDLKYLLAYVLPLSAYLALYLKGNWSYLVLIVAFIIIPILDSFSPKRTDNSSPEKADNRIFDWLLYGNVPLIYGLLVYFFYTLSYTNLSTFELIGQIQGVGIILGSMGINVAHELGHRQTKLEQTLAQLLLLPNLYMHFTLEHNLGHHKHIATEKDPATARLNETIYAFWFRSTTCSFINAWKLENKRLQRQQKKLWSRENQQLRFLIIELTYLVGIGVLFGFTMIAYAIAIAIIGFLLLESVNYIEHYGLRRRQLNSGRYEAVNVSHSWSSNHEIGRIFLYELTRHADHHYKANRKYQILRHWDESPLLPFGYPASILLALLPPLWFLKMNPLVPKVNLRNDENINVHF